MITARQIANWAATSEAQRELPRLIRRLTHSSATTTQIAMPAGDSTTSPGFDGELYSETGSPWVPKGHSCWELSCRNDATPKANEDYDKRTAALSDEDLAGRTYVAVTARKWPGKANWIIDKLAEGKWAGVRAYDADDLEQWLEQSPAVAVAFGDELGINGPGVTSLSSYLSSWSTQCDPTISSAALLVGREQQRDRILTKCLDAKAGTSSTPVSVKADSVEEAVAFVAASLGQDESLTLRAVVVSDLAGWRFVERNTEIRIAVAARPEIAEIPPKRDGLILIVPYASGDMAKQFRGMAGRLDDPETSLDRADHPEFKEALQEIGIDENDSRRLSDLCGRSWSVFRRQHAVNPSIRRPRWLDHPSASALAAVCLVGTWSSDKMADKEAVARVAVRPYDELERDLLELERLDDSPVLHIGTVWKAKSALELLSLFGDRITKAEIDRFFVEAKAILSAPDPELELPESERYAAAVYGKTRPISGLLLDAFCDTLVKLAVRGPAVPSLAGKHIDSRVDKLVRELLRDADATRWLSLSSALPALAEASPDEFLTAVEDSLARSDAPVRSLLTETDSEGAFFGGRCWHAGLLWALEVLGWAPQRLSRVSLILAQLAETQIAGNWSNRPENSLVDFYRTWLPQTAATVEQRIAALDVLIDRETKAAVRLLDALTNTGHDLAHHTARPKWRDDDSGAGYGATGAECYTMLTAAADRHLLLAKQDAQQIAALVRKYPDFDDGRRKIVVDLLNSLNDRSDEEKETVRAALRSRIYWHRNYDDKQNEVDALLDPLESAYERLAPTDLAIGNAWLFKDGWVELPARYREAPYDERHRLIARTRGEVLAELYQQESWSGVVRFAEYANAGWQVGRVILTAGVPLDDVLTWIVTSSGDLERGTQLTMLAAGMTSAVIEQEGYEVVGRLLSLAEMHRQTLDWKVRLLTLAPEGRQIWTIANKLGPEAHDLYWQTCVGGPLLRNDTQEMEYALKQLLQADRPVTALGACHIKFDGIDPELTMQMLEGMLRGVEPDARLPEHYHIQEAIDHVEASGQIDRMRLAQLEFGLIKALGFRGEHHAVSLYHVLMSRPEVFVELLGMLYKPRDGEVRETTEEEKAAADNAWCILHACKRQPGTAEDGSVTDEMLAEFVHEARKLAVKKDLLERCDSRLGQIMARAPYAEDGVFPCEPVRNVLEAINSEAMLRGFSIGCFNKRGMHSRGVFDGGEQERELASSYRANAKALEITHPHLSAVLESLAKSYDRDGLMEDLEVRLRRERL